jgi:hypothetical protein
LNFHSTSLRSHFDSDFPVTELSDPVGFGETAAWAGKVRPEPPTQVSALGDSGLLERGP